MLDAGIQDRQAKCKQNFQFALYDLKRRVILRRSRTNWMRGFSGLGSVAASKSVQLLFRCASPQCSYERTQTSGMSKCLAQAYLRCSGGL
jgi:hypothetical protein